MLNLTETEKAYLAGLFDGEGCVGYYKRKGRRAKHCYMSLIAISQSDMRLMLWLQERIPFGSVYGKRGKKAFEYKWETNKRADVYTFLLTIQPYLVLKKEQVDVLLRHLEKEGLEPKLKGEVTPAILAQREQVYTELRRLKVCHKLAIH